RNRNWRAARAGCARCCRSRTPSMPDFFTHDALRRDPAPRDWGDAFAALPLEAVPSGAWAAIAAKLDAPRRRRHWSKWSWPLAAAAALLLAIAPAWWSRTSTEPTLSQPARAVADATPPEAGAATLDRLHAESAQLEALLQYARDPRVASGTAAAISA